MQSLILDFLKVTEKAAISVMPWVGSGNKISADYASTNSMRKSLNDIAMSASIVIGEGEIDEAPMLYIGERLGQGRYPWILLSIRLTAQHQLQKERIMP